MATFDSPFTRDELLGWFRWNVELTKSLRASGSWVYHACHENHLRRFHTADELWLRSGFEVEVSKTITSRFECSWLSLQPWHLTHGHNHFGPLTIKLPMTILDGRRFYLFKRVLRGWRHYYLVQREDKTPLFGPRHPASRYEPRKMFDTMGSGLTDRDYTQYEIILTQSVALRGSRFIATDHRRCVPRECSGMTRQEAVGVINEIVDESLERLAKRFPQAKTRLQGIIDSQS